MHPHIRRHTITHAYMYTHTCTLSPTHTVTHAHVYTHILAHSRLSYTHTCTHSHTHTYTYTHTRVHSQIHTHVRTLHFLGFLSFKKKINKSDKGLILPLVSLKKTKGWFYNDAILFPFLWVEGIGEARGKITTSFESSHISYLSLWEQANVSPEARGGGQKCSSGACVFSWLFRWA